MSELSMPTRRHVLAAVPAIAATAALPAGATAGQDANLPLALPAEPAPAPALEAVNAWRAAWAELYRHGEADKVSEWHELPGWDAEREAHLRVCEAIATTPEGLAA